MSWYEAVAFCLWLTARLSYTVRLPTEFEWQQAATGGDIGKEYPWGEWHDGRCNSSESHLNRTTTVGLYPHGTWKDGPLDMAGNVFEWCLNKFAQPIDISIDQPRVRRVLRGGSGLLESEACRTSNRQSSPPELRYDSFGFRVSRPSSGGH